MNADDRATPPAEGLYRPPVTRDPAQPQGIRPTASAPQQASTGQVPQRAPFRSGQFATSAPATHAPSSTTPAPAGTRPAAPAAGSAFTPTAPRTAAPAPGFPVTGTQPAKAPAAASSDEGAVGSVKGFALRAKNSLTEGDDLKAASSKGGPRKVRVLVSRVDPFSALKIGFLLSIAAGIMLTVAVYVVWNVLNEMGLFALANEWISKLFTTDQELNILQFFDQNKVMSATVLIAVVNVVLLSALATIGAFLYNTVSSVVGGIYLTLTDD
ncbi:MAG: hypothetical protein CVT64_01940 [Actinobacteria bacterium HGW-Actinobacteria-4]|nr:MAG: hypothetical protein CVT64_01940 [Actinobacteria bacterium HGW-Actinobacteria-4]